MMLDGVLRSCSTKLGHPYAALLRAKLETP